MAFSKQENQVWYVRCSLQVSYMQQYTLGVYLVLVRAVYESCTNYCHRVSNTLLVTACVVYTMCTVLEKDPVGLKIVEKMKMLKTWFYTFYASLEAVPYIHTYIHTYTRLKKHYKYACQKLYKQGRDDIIVKVIQSLIPASFSQ